MKKRMIMLLCTLSTVGMLFSGCGKTTETIQPTSAMSSSYFLFRTTDVQDYFNFLENFDETKYEIVDISTSMDPNSDVYGSSEFYIITYRTFAE